MDFLRDFSLSFVSFVFMPSVRGWSALTVTTVIKMHKVNVNNVY